MALLQQRAAHDSDLAKTLEVAQAAVDASRPASPFYTSCNEYLYEATCEFKAEYSGSDRTQP